MNGSAVDNLSNVKFSSIKASRFPVKANTYHMFGEQNLLSKCNFVHRGYFCNACSMVKIADPFAFNTQ